MGTRPNIEGLDRLTKLVKDHDGSLADVSSNSPEMIEIRRAIYPNGVPGQSLSSTKYSTDVQQQVINACTKFNMTSNEIGDLLKIPPSSVRRILNVNGIYLDHRPKTRAYKNMMANLDRIRELRRHGGTLKSISKEIGVSYATLKGAIWRYQELGKVWKEGKN